MKYRFNWFLLFVCVLFAAVSGVAQKTWEKPYGKWSKDDALKIVSDSPWAVTYQNSDAAIFAGQQQVSRDQRDTVNSGGGGRGAGSAARSGGPSPIVVRLHSGYPIRQAITRARQLAAGYDKFDDTQKKQFDEANKGFLLCGICTDYYVISVTKLPDSSGESVQEAIFQRFALKDLQGNVWLVNEKGEQRPLFQFTPPKRSGEAAYFFFARKDEKGNTLISPEDKNFKLVFNNSFFTGSNPYAIYFPRSMEFKVSKIMIGDSLAF